MDLHISLVLNICIMFPFLNREYFLERQRFVSTKFKEPARSILVVLTSAHHSRWCPGAMPLPTAPALHPRLGVPPTHPETFKALPV